MAVKDFKVECVSLENVTKDEITDYSLKEGIAQWCKASKKYEVKLETEIVLERRQTIESYLKRLQKCVDANIEKGVSAEHIKMVARPFAHCKDCYIVEILSNVKE